jgi:glycerophosphoryl diester phosphodiesterase
LANNDWLESDNDYDYLRSESGLQDIAAIAVGIGPWFGHLVDSESGSITPLVKHAKNLGLSIHPYTFRADQLPSNMTSDQTLDLLFNRIGVDGVFSDHTDVVKAYLKRQ